MEYAEQIICVNARCGTSTSSSWKRGWRLRNGQFADLCENCGLAFEQSRFCETFHADDTGWRTCNSCRKRVHCGCIASVGAFILLDTGGVECSTCIKREEPFWEHSKHAESSLPTVIAPEAGITGIYRLDAKAGNADAHDWAPINHFAVRFQEHAPEPANGLKNEFVHENMSATDANQRLTLKHGSTDLGESNSCEMGSMHGEDDDHEDMKSGSLQERKDIDRGHGIFNREAIQKDMFPENGVPDYARFMMASDPSAYATKDSENFGNLKSLIGGISGRNLADGSPCLNMSLGIPAKKEAAGDMPSGTGMLAAGSSGPGGDTGRYALPPYRPNRHRQILPRPPQPVNSRSETTKSEAGGEPPGGLRVARPPAEGRGRNQLLPRYWPRITDQEIKQITSGDSNSIIIPLFEKMLSASDAGRIGRLVLPKACAEAYFPPISAPEGLPLKISDVTGKEWQFQFRYWPNNNSRMYVLEGVTPCIQSMRLQAGDTVTFSRLDPVGKLIMGFRRAASSTLPDAQPPNSSSAPTLPSNGDSGVQVHAPKDSQVGSLSGPSDSGYDWKSEKAVEKTKDGSMFHAMWLADKKKGRPLGAKSKRLRLDNEDALELKATWEEAQELLRPAPGVNPTFVVVDGHQFEEYEEPPVLAKKTYMTTRASGDQDQWVQCDDCLAWRKVPVDVFLHTRWVCSENIWNPTRASCNALREFGVEDVDQLHGFPSELPKQESVEGQPAMESSSGLDALANAAAFGENATASPPPPAPTTKHPRHRPGCTCIVCIQPPSGKGPKHKPNCVCNVCMTVKRRFKTLMMRRKKRQSEREAETARKKRGWEKDDGEVTSGSKWPGYGNSITDNGKSQGGPFRETLSNKFLVSGFPYTGISSGMEESSMTKGQIDLNSQPDREEGAVRISMMRLLKDASLPLDMYLKQQGMTSLLPNLSTGLPVVNSSRPEKRNDQQSSSQAALQSQDHSQEEVS